MRIHFTEAKQTLQDILAARGCPTEKAEKVAHEIARNTLEGTYSHGLPRFARLIRSIEGGIVRAQADPVLHNGFGAIENYDGQLGLGITNAAFAMGRAITLARTHGIGLVALRNTNHWFRAATYGYQACDAGMAGICFTNTMPNMPAWGATDARLGNNPLVLAFPRQAGAVIVDMAMSQFSYGAMEMAKMAGRQMPVDAGYDERGELSRDPAAVMRTHRVLPTGYWKGAALSFLLDTFAGCISLGNTVAAAGRLSGDEHGASQVFIAINHTQIAPEDACEAILEDSLAYLLASRPENEAAAIRYPGEKAVRLRAENLRLGLPVDDAVWAEILSLT